jgi:hypothetical protein
LEKLLEESRGTDQMNFQAASRNYRSDLNAHVVNLDRSCAIYASSTAVLKLDPSHWLGVDRASHELAKFRDTPANEPMDLADLRTAIGPEFARYVRSVIDWFPPRIFLSAMIDAMPKLKESTSFWMLGESEAVNMLDVIYTHPASLEEIIKENKIVFLTLPPVLIVHTGLHGSGINLKFTYPKELTLSTVASETKRYTLKAKTFSSNSHSNLGSEFLRQDYGFNSFHRENLQKLAPDLLFYEEEQQPTRKARSLYRDIAATAILGTVGGAIAGPAGALAGTALGALPGIIVRANDHLRGRKAMN